MHDIPPHITVLFPSSSCFPASLFIRGADSEAEPESEPELEPE